MLQVTIAR